VSVNLGPMFNTLKIYGREATLLSIHYQISEIDNSETKTHTAY